MVYRSFEEMPYSLTVEEVGKFLRISRTSAYNLVHSPGFPSLRVGSRIIILKPAFERWLEANNVSETGSQDTTTGEVANERRTLWGEEEGTMKGP